MPGTVIHCTGGEGKVVYVFRKHLTTQCSRYPSRCSPEQHDEQQEVTEKAEDDEESIEDDDNDEEPGVFAEERPEVGGGEVHRGVAVEAGQQLHERLDESRMDAANRIILVVSAAVIVSTVVQLKS